MKLAFYFTLACTAECDHCVTFAGPDVKRTMTLEEAKRAIAMAAQTPDIDTICFTGGENLMRRRPMLELVESCSALNLRSEIVTNAFWATSPRAARRLLEPFRAAGLRRLPISIDRYHLPYVPVERVHIALQVAEELGFLREIAGVVDGHYEVKRDLCLAEAFRATQFDADNWNEADAERLSAALRQAWPVELRQLLDLYRFDHNDLIWVEQSVAIRELPFRRAGELAHHFSRTKIFAAYQTLATEGRARNLLPETATLSVDEAPDEPCDSVAHTPSVNPEGDLFPCCSSWVNLPHQRFGNIKTQTLSAFSEELKQDIVVQFIRDKGPRALIKLLRDRGHALPERYSHPCHFCGTALENFTREELAANIRAFYAEQGVPA